MSGNKAFPSRDFPFMLSFVIILRGKLSYFMSPNTKLHSFFFVTTENITKFESLTWRTVQLKVTYDTEMSVVSERNVSQPPGRGPVPGPDISYTGPREVSPGICHFSFLSNFFMNKCFVVEIFWGEKYSWNVSKNLDSEVGLRKLQYATRFH